MNRSEPQQRLQEGQAMVEMVVVIFTVLLLLLGILQFALVYNAKSVLNYATFEAARMGAVNHGSPEAMKYALAQKLAAARPSPANTQLLDSAYARLQASQALMIEEIESNENVCIERISPMASSGHWGAVASGSGYDQEIPNSHLLYRENTPDSGQGISIQDANLLKIRVTYCHPLVVPVISTTIKRLMLASYANTDPDPIEGWQVPVLEQFERSCYERDRMPIEAQAIARMQTPIRNYSFPAYCN